MSQKNSKLGIIIPVYNLEEYIPRCLDSIYGQGVDNDLFEVIIVNDGSSDGSRDVIDSYCAKYPNITAIHQENAGVSAARNSGMARCKSVYFAFLDADDELHPGSLTGVLDFLDRYDADVAYFQSFLKEADGSLSLINEWSWRYSEDHAYRKMELLRNNTFLNGGCVWGCVYRRSFIQDNRLEFAPGIRNNEDSMFNYRMLSKSGVIRFAAIPFYLNTVREGSASRSESVDRVRGYANNMAYALKLYESSENVFDRQIADVCLYNTIAAAGYMYLRVGGKDWRELYDILGIKTLHRLRVPWFPLEKRLKILLINTSFRLYMGLMSRKWSKQ